MASATPAGRLRSAAKPMHVHSPRTRVARKSTPRVYYGEDLSETSTDDNFYDEGPFQLGRSPRSNPRSLPNPKKRKASKTPPHAVLPTKRVQKRAINPDMVRDDGIEVVTLPGKKMPWNTLPYHILVAVFDYASRPLVYETLSPCASITWLLHAALSCKSFLEPALTALYYSPPLTPPTRARALIEHLASQNETSTFDYRAKIKYLEIEASSVLMHKISGEDPVDLGRLIAMTPQLRGIRVRLLSDNLKFRTVVDQSVNGKPAYHHLTFVALEENHIRLQDWMWNQALAKQTCPLTSLRRIHTMTPFQSLRDIHFVRYEASASRSQDKSLGREDLLADAINALPCLKGLHFKMSSIVNERLMAKLPQLLHTLEIISCSSLKSEALSEFLRTGARSLRRLILNHNNSLNLSFLSHLGVDCPSLQELKMDLLYFNSNITFRSSNPQYESLLHGGEVPVWPAGLQRLELYHLRRWDLPTAKLFFSSLVDAAKDLPDLRQLRIKATIEESAWRDRICFRNKWTETLNHVFQRRSSPPNPQLQSITCYKMSKWRQHKDQVPGHDSAHSNITKRATVSGIEDTDPSQSKLTEVTAKTAENASDSDRPLMQMRKSEVITKGKEEMLSRLRRSKRTKPLKDNGSTLSESSTHGGKRHRKKRRGSKDSSSEDSAIDEDGAVETDQSSQRSMKMPDFRQGRCDVVEVLIDNLRPMEEQLKEKDFLDTEISGDESWNEENDMLSDGGYAW